MFGSDPQLPAWGPVYSIYREWVRGECLAGNVGRGSGADSHGCLVRQGSDGSSYMHVLVMGSTGVPARAPCLRLADDSLLCCTHCAVGHPLSRLLLPSEDVL